ncbi:MAG: cellulase family glycosylhydrolase [Clostridia bacterium]|nr:cellulase family glycosylhydrolase [Clostridia bacterium]
MNFIIGCNYWASNAGADMWRDFDIDAVREDLRVLSENGVKHMRVFPNWRDFQPVMPLFAGQGELVRYCLEGEREADNPYFLDRVMLERFAAFLDVCDSFGIRVVVGLITGWMSGRLYTPSALYGKNVITDPTANYFEQLFIRGFVSTFKHRDAIYAWDLGNECNCMAPASRIEAARWTALMANAIRAEDPSRPIVSGMHGLKLSPEESWQVRDQAMWCDILTTHPYPFWGAFTRNDDITSIRTTLHATAESKLYAECGGKPCLCEEIGTMGPMLSSESAAADFARVNLFSNLANGSAGFMWWCAHEQTSLFAFPYSDNMVETELGLLRPDRSPKPVMLEIKKFSELIDKLDFDLPAARTDAVCLLSHGQSQWGIAFMTYVLARQAGLNLRFAYADDGIPDAGVYLLPSVNGIRVMDAKRYAELKARVADGAELYISMDNGVLSELSDLIGMSVVSSFEAPECRPFTYLGREYRIPTRRTYTFTPVGAEILAKDDTGAPVLSVFNYGKGRVTFLNRPLEESLIDSHDGFADGLCEIYRSVFSSALAAQDVTLAGEGVCTTVHGERGADTLYVIAVNHTAAHVATTLRADGYRISRTLHGSADSIAPYGATILELVKEYS